MTRTRAWWLVGASALTLALAAGGCKNKRNAAAELIKPPEYAPGGQAKCTVQASQTRPLVVEWPAADRASLEARLTRGLVAVRASGCEIEVLRQCTVPGTYSYLGLTRKNEQVTIRDTDDLYAKLPLGAVNLEAKLARSGRLDVKLALVGMFEAPGLIDRAKLTGDCGSATHVISGAQVGAFLFSSGGAAEIGGGIDVKNTAAVGASSTAEQELLSADGDPNRCDAATSADQRPPEGCGAVLRIELTALGAPTCAAGSHWDGHRCVISYVYCPPNTDPVNGRCVARAPAPAPAPAQPQPAPTKPAETKPATSENPDEQVCRDYCTLGIRCEAEKKDMPPPEGDGLTGLQRMCVRSCKIFTNDFNRPALRQCVADGCAGIVRCTSKFGGM